jgi:deoxyribose-phosphate aldolase
VLAEEYEVEVIEDLVPAVIESTAIEKPKKGKLSKRTEKVSAEEDEDYSAFKELALLMNTTVSAIKDECCSFQIKNLMGRMGKALVRFGVNDKQMEKILLNADILGVQEVVISPSNLETCAKAVKKHNLERQKVTLLIDFPFGESSFENKLLAIKEGKKAGVDGITVTLQQNALSESRQKELKKQLKKISRSFKGDVGIAVSAEELTDNELKNLLKLTAKTKIKHVALLFGAVSEDTLISKLNFANKYKGKLKYKVLGNIETAVAVMNLFKLEVDVILTPYADDIGGELLKRFKVKSLKLN